jgi:arylsulfatase A-like enzyme
MPSRKNTLFIMIDQLRADCVTGALSQHVKLPNIRALQSEAVTFTNHFSVTNPCGPSRASILTGLYAMNHRSVRNGTPMSEGITNIALEMRKLGFDPLLFGYTDTSRDPRGKSPDDPVLQTYEEVMPGFTELLEMRQETGSRPWQKFLRDKGYDTPDYKNFYVPKSPDSTRPPRPDDPAFYAAEDSDTAFLTDEFLRQMAAPPSKPWFALLTYIRPHPPLVAPAPYNQLYQGDTLPMPARQTDPADEVAVHPAFVATQNRPPMESFVKGCNGQISAKNDADVQMLRALYLGLATEVDAHIGRVISFLKETGQYDDTLIVLSADHGEMLGDHHMWGKQHIYDPSFRVPLVIRDPLSPESHGSTVAALTESIDLAPTILDLAGGKAAPGMNGRSLGGFLNSNPPDNWKDCVHLELDLGEPDTPTAFQRLTGLELRESNVAILREAHFKLVHFNGDLPPLMFDLNNDPDEMHNLADDPAHAATLLRLTRKLLSHRMKHADHALSDYKITDSGVFPEHPT